MAEALVAVVLEQLVTVSFHHAKEAVKLITSAETEVAKFKSNLETIQSVLEDAEKQQVEKATVRNWLDKLNDVSYEMVDVLDEWNTEILKQAANAEEEKTSEKVCFPSTFRFGRGQATHLSHLYKIATEMKELNERLTQITNQKKDFEFHQSSTRRNDEQLKQLPQTSSFLPDSKIFGREEAKDDLLSKLSSDSSEKGKGVPVIPIVGMGGMGKTTLAQLAYNSEQLACNNEDVKTYIWVCVKHPFNGVKIARAIISGTGENAPNSDELQDVLVRMSECIEGKKCFIFLDDVRTEDPTEWESLKLPSIMEKNCAKGSKIVVTTRKEKVAQIMGATTQMIRLEKLSDENCLKLFNSIAHSKRKADEANRFGAIGEKIAKKCNGLPLAAKTLGALLREKEEMGDWQEVLDSEIWLLKEVEQQVFQPLLLSYYELTPIVKRCLLYLVTFPKDYRFKKYNLIELWMSQDYLSGKNYEEKEKIGQNVFNTLVMRSFFQDVVKEVDRYDNSITVSCKMHHIVHDFVQFLNKNECFPMEAKEVDGRKTVKREEVRHLRLMFAPIGSPLSDFISRVNPKKLRTLATFDSRMSGVDIKAISQLKSLRTLNLSCNSIAELPEEMGELIHLRYLDLSENRCLEKLPDSVGNLYNLQTLCLTGCDRLGGLPENMGNLINLRHLHTWGCANLEYLPRGMRRLTSLQTLNTCPVTNDSGPGKGLKLGDLGSLGQLQGSLKIQIKGNLKDTDASEARQALLSNKKLRYLRLNLQKLEKQSHVKVLEALEPHQHLKNLRIFSYRGTTAPSWMTSLQSLRSLSLDCWYECKLLPPLGKLPLLEELKVSEMDKVKTVGDEFLGIPGTQTSSSSSSVLFPNLKQLTFRRMREWEQWEGVGGSTENGGDEITIMPCLVSLTIFDCPKLMNRPLFLQKTPVKKIFISDCNFLPPLGKLPFLEELNVSGMGKVKTVGDEFLGITGTPTSSSSVLFPKLKQLTFRWMSEWKQWEGVGGWTENSGDEITIMPCLVSFTIANCPQLMNLPLFLQKTPVKKIVISECNFLPPLGKLPFLEELYVSGMGKVKTVGDEFLGITGTPTSSPSSSSSVLFPKLKQLHFSVMSEWKQWEGVGGWTENGGDEITIMPCLVSFKIFDCRKLMNLPLFLQKTPVRNVEISFCRRSIIIPVMPDNCDVNISGEIEDPVIPDVTEGVETETQRDEEITTIT